MSRLALVVSTRRDVAVATDLATAARDRHIDVALFFMDLAVAELATVPATASELSDMGCELTVCASSADHYGVAVSALPDVAFGSQDDHAALVHRADRVVAFT